MFMHSLTDNTVAWKEPDLSYAGLLIAGRRTSAYFGSTEAAWA